MWLHIRQHHPELSIKACVTAQHRHLLDQVLRVFEVQPDYDLDCMQAGQTLFQSTSRILAALEPVLAAERPDLLLVQGDRYVRSAGGIRPDSDTGTETYAKPGMTAQRAAPSR